MIDVVAMARAAPAGQEEFVSGTSTPGGGAKRPHPGSGDQIQVLWFMLGYVLSFMLGYSGVLWYCFAAAVQSNGPPRSGWRDLSARLSNLSGAL